MPGKSKKQEGEMVLTAQFKRAFIIGSLGAFVVSIGTFAASRARADNGDDARAVLKAMSDYISGQKSIAATFNSDIEVITPDLQKIQFDSSGKVQLNRPDKVHASRTGGYTDVELFFDGKTFVVANKKDKAFTQAETPGSVDELVEKLRRDFGVEMPGADLFLSNPYQVLSADVIDAKHVGRGVVNGVECEHLAFRNHDTDWQIWVQAGANPVPCKFVITSKAVTGGPQYTLLITDWKGDATIPPDAFTYKAPDTEKKVEFKSLSPIDEVPPGVIKGSKP
jgi:hypothetical protein